MKLKISLGEGGIKGLLAQHVEKFVLGVALVLVVYFVYSSATQEGLDQKNRPDDLKRQGENAISFINMDNWRSLAPDRESKVEDFPAKADEARAKIIESDYALGNIWDKPNIPRRAKRSDPKLFPPLEVEVEAVVAAVAVKTASPTDPFAGDKLAVAKPKEVPKPKPKKPTRPKGPPGMEMYSDTPGGPADYAEMMGAGAPDPTAGMASPYMGSGSTGLDGARTVGPFYKEHYLTGNGWQAGFGGVQTTGKVVGRSYAVVAVKALVPYEKQWEEYERALADATGYSPQQDIPRYLSFQAERAEVPDDPDAELQWVPIANSAVAMQRSMLYADFPKEIADENYTLPGVLTMPIPPLLLQPYDSMALHREIPRRQHRNLQSGMTQAKPEVPGDITAPVTSDISEGLNIPKIGPGTGTGMPYGPGMDPSMSGMPYAEGMGMPGMEGGASYGSPYGGIPGAMQQPLVKHKLVRFFDFTAEAGKSYRYRVCLVLEDPNRPQNPAADPNKRILDDTVVQRLRQVEADDEDYSKKNNKPRRTYYVKTDWSEPSPIVTIEPRGNFLAGSVVPPRTTRLSVDGPEIELSEVSGKLVSVVWDPLRAIEVPAERTVFRGSMLNFKQHADVLHPLTQQIRTIEDYEFNTEAFVADIRGGNLLYEDKKKENPLHAPGEMLVIDGDGNLLVRDEVDCIEDYRRVMFVDDSPSGPMGGSMPYGGAMPGGPAEMYMGGDPAAGLFPGAP